MHCPAPRLLQEVIPYISAFVKSQPKKMVKLQAQKEFRSIKQWSIKAKVIARNYLNLTTQYDTNNETDVPGKHLDLISSSKCPISV
mgnify:CR=1 FL=1